MVLKRRFGKAKTSEEADWARSRQLWPAVYLECAREAQACIEAASWNYASDWERLTQQICGFDVMPSFLTYRAAECSDLAKKDDNVAGAGSLTCCDLLKRLLNFNLAQG